MVAGITGVVTLAAVVFAFGEPVSANASTGNSLHPPGGGALFVMTDNPSGNQVIVYQHAASGALMRTGAYGTGGDGAIAAGSAVDPLASQKSLALAARSQFLLAVNAGSDSVSVFRITGNQLALSDVVPSGGSFPSSIAISGSLVYVLNAGDAGSVQGFTLTPNGRLSPISGSNRSLGLDNASPPFFLDAPGQVGFTPSGSQLIVTTKNSGSDIDVFSIDSSGLPSSDPVVNPAVAPIPFAFTFDAAGNLMVTEAGASELTSYAVSGDGSVTPIGSAVDGQAALCWVSEDDGYFYGSNAGTANVSQFREGASGTPALIGVPTSTGSGATDSAVSSGGQFLYVEEGGAGTVYEFEVGSGGVLTQIGVIAGLSAPMEGIAAT